ncbi:MAG TPA: YajQ family cyclic di-GMP-binding protein [Candidatus Sulfotelmatobacter sp.]|nr:YajQ family cyclic di-GMP-binding protein [Candidatus Sulfotelmatobacter sp.]
MAKDVSFDIASKIDLQEVDNAIQQTQKEILQRFDFKGAKVTVRREENTIVLQADDEFKLRSVVEVLEAKLVKRKVPLRGLSYGKVEPAAGSTVRQEATIQQGIPTEKAREIVKRIKGMGLRVQVQIMEDQVRVSGRSKDDLQTVIQELRKTDVGIDMQFTNYR